MEISKYIENELEILVKKAASEDEIPVGCVICCNGEIIGRGYNMKNKSNCVLDHAEIIAIREASLKKGTWNLSDCDLYCSLEPCDMCREVIKQSYIKNTYYILKKDNIINYKYNNEQVYASNCDLFSKMLKDFFINKR